MNRARRRLAFPRPRPEALEIRALLSAPGSLDSTFGGGHGYTTLPFETPVSIYNATPGSVVEETNGDIVVSGTTTSYPQGGDIEVASSKLVIDRFHPDGTPDTSFGGGGQVQVPINANQSASTAVQADGKIVVALSSTDLGGNATYLAIRLDLDGSLDSNFGSSGFAYYPASVATPVADRLGASGAVIPVLQANGLILLTGLAAPIPDTTVFAAVRLNTDGSLDSNYGQDGTANVNVTVNGYTSDQLVAPVLQSDGRLVMVGEVLTFRSDTDHIILLDHEIAAVRLNTDGSLDTAYGETSGAGTVLIPPDLGMPLEMGDGKAVAAAIQPGDGKLIISGTSSSASSTSGNALYRLNTDGSLDPTLGTDGMVGALFSGSVAAQQDGKILVAGTSTDLVSRSASYYSFPDLGSDVLRLNADGSTDTTFGNTPTPGVAMAYPGTSPYQAVSIQPTDGSLLLAGVGTVPSLGGRLAGFTVGRFLPSTSTAPPATPIHLPPASLLGNLQTQLAIYDPATSTFQFASASNSSDVIDVPFGGGGVGGTIPAVANYSGSSQDQIAAYLPAQATYAVQPVVGDGPDLYYHFGIAGPGQSIPVPADYEGTGKDDVAIYMPAIAAYAILPSDGSPGRIVYIGQPGLGNSIPAPADYFGTGQAEPAVYLANFGAFAVPDPTGKTSGEIVPFGTGGQGDIPVPGDYDGSGHVELAVYIPLYGQFVYRPYAGGPDVTVNLGAAGIDNSLPVPGDYDGSGHLEFAVYDSKDGDFTYRPANGAPDAIIALGTAGDGVIPVAAPGGSLPEFAASKSGGNGSGSAISVPGSSSSSSISSGGTVRAASVPSGSMAGSARLARKPINQASPDPLQSSTCSPAKAPNAAVGRASRTA